MRPIGRVWRLGAFLLTPDGALLHTDRAELLLRPPEGA